MKNFDSWMGILILVTILGIGALDIYAKWDRYDLCRSRHGIVYCAIAS